MSKGKQRMGKREITEEYKQDAVGLVVSQGISVAQAAEDLGIGKSTFEKWVRLDRSDHPEEKRLSLLEREELRQLGKENQTLRMERDFLNKNAAFFAWNPI